MTAPSRIVVAFILWMAVALTACADVLVWMVTDAATVDGQGIMAFLSPEIVDDDNWNAARVKVTGAGLSEPMYLDIYFEDGWTEGGELGVEFWENGNGMNGVGVPVGVQSPLGAELSAEAMFSVELGHNVYDELGDNVTWTTLAESDAFARSALENYIYEQFDLNPPSNGIWSPMEFHTVPEPDAWILAMVGMAFLMMLRRRGVSA